MPLNALPRCHRYGGKAATANPAPFRMMQEGRPSWIFLRMTRLHSRPNGFTLIELVATLALLAVLCTVATPALQGLAARTARSSVQNDLLHALRSAREHAIVRGVRTEVCPSRDGRHCSGGAHWEQGWLGAVDGDADGVPDQVPFIVGSGADHHGTIILGADSRPRVRFQADGSAAGTNLRLTVCTLQAPHTGEALVVANSGRIRRTHADAAHLGQCLDAAAVTP